MKTRPKIVISNDDGIEAPGLETLVALLEGWADCRVVAPDGPRSGIGHALSADSPISLRTAQPGRSAAQ